ncbi:MAG TPA: response regulator [Candidatus Eisenbacteria bacterium]|nr:response regulator [Candidatus Eisenbacteria bacterium]
MRILIVEDDAMNAKLFDVILTRKAGFQVEITEDPERVRVRAREGSVDVIILDVSLSNSTWHGVPVDGLEICRRLKRDPETAAVPVLLATAHAMKGAREKFLSDSGADDYVSKPIVSADELIDTIRALARKGVHGTASPPR